jgi:hypothetical protein
LSSSVVNMRRYIRDSQQLKEYELRCENEYKVGRRDRNYLFAWVLSLFSARHYLTHSLVRSLHALLHGGRSCSFLPVFEIERSPWLLDCNENVIAIKDATPMLFP